MRSVWKVPGHFEYLENLRRGIDVTWQPVRGDLTVHLWTVTLPWGQSVGSEMPLTELVYCVTVQFTLTKQADQLHHDNAPAHSAAIVPALLAKHHTTQVCQSPYSPDLAPRGLQLFQKLKVKVKVAFWRFFNTEAIWPIVFLLPTSSRIHLLRRHASYRWARPLPAKAGTITKFC